MIDCHIHFAESLDAARLSKVIKEENLEGAALLCIPKGGEMPTEHDAFQYKDHSDIPVYVFGGIDRNVFHNGAEADGAILVKEVRRLMDMGCTGIKMLEGKPDVRKHFKIPDFDSDIFAGYFKLLEQEKIPVVFHVNDPEEFWDGEKVSEYAKKAGWFYDHTYINNEVQYRQVLNVLKRYPKLNLLFPHFFFLSRQLERLADILDTYQQVKIDVTPGIELYYNLSENIEKAKLFFDRYQDRICYGTDIGARSVILKENKSLSIEESRSRISLIRTFLECGDDYILAPDGKYVKEGEPVLMHGLGLNSIQLEKIYRVNFLNFIRPL